MTRRVYPSDLSDAEWQVIAPLIPPAKLGGRPREVDMREIVNGIFYVTRSGCAWGMLPHDFPPWSTVYHYFRAWRKEGTWEEIHDALRARVRIQAGRNPQPSAAILDSQSVKTTEKGGLEVMTRPRRSTAASGIFSWIPEVSFWRSWCTRQTFRTAMGRRWCWRREKMTSPGLC